MVQSSQEGAQYVWKRGARGHCFVVLPYYPSLSLQSLLLAKHSETKFKFFPIRASNSADMLSYFREARDLYKFILRAVLSYV